MLAYTLRGTLRLPRAVKSLKGWSRLAPGATRQPLPWEVCAAIASVLLTSDGLEPALAWLLMVDCYLRPSESLKLVRRQMLMPTTSEGMGLVALHLNPTALGKRSKTGELDESVVVSRPWLSKVIEKFVGNLQREQLFPFPLTEMRGMFVRAAGVCGIARFHPVFYMGRHSGASLDRLLGRLPLNGMKKRGRWRTDASIRRVVMDPRRGQCPTPHMPALTWIRRRWRTMIPSVTTTVKSWPAMSSSRVTTTRLSLPDETSSLRRIDSVVGFST